jgi:OFA family oxalate/formate antiporter-like MFS transporter
VSDALSRPRWTVIIGAVLIQTCLGAVYAWSLFNLPLMEKFGWSKEPVVLTFSIAIFMFAFSTIGAGKLQDMFGPRVVASGGAILLGVGLALASRATELWHLYVAYGVVGGIGIGTAYVTPIATCMKWYPDKRGFIAGVSVVGMGLGGIVFKPVILALLAKVGVSSAFLYLGAIYAVAILIGAQFLILPPKGYVPAGWIPPVKKNATEDFSTAEMLRTPQFYALWMMFLFGCTSGLTVISMAVNIGVEYVGVPAATAAYAVVAIAVANAAGRPFWGMTSDRVGRMNSLMAIYAMTAGVMVYMSAGYVNQPLFFLLMTLVGFGFGGFLAIFPSVSADFYGTKHIGMNYGLLYAAWGASAFVGPFLRSFLDLQQSFMAAGILSVAAGIAAYLVKHPASLAKPVPVSA